MRQTPLFLAPLTALALAGCAGSAAHDDPSNIQQQAATAPHLVVLSDPGHVTYSTHPAGCQARGTGPATYRPDPACTPGGIDPKVTQANLASTICKSGYTATVRPPSSETGKAKTAQYQAYGIRTGTTSELDHLVSLELGGDNDIANLWPEVGTLPNPKDKVENDLHRAVCAGRVKLSAAQLAIATDWTTAESKLGLS